MDDILHKIRVYLYENLLTENPNDYSAKVISERSLGVKEICQMAVKRGGAPSTAEAMEHNVMLFLKEMAYSLCDGFSVNTGYFVANAQVRGVFEHAKEHFNPEKHAVLFRFNQGELLRREIPNVTVEVMGVGETDIVISHVVDSKTGSVNDLVTLGGTLKIRGAKLKIAGDSPQVGVFLEDSANGARFMIGNNDIIVNNPSELIVQIPTIKPGKYRLVLVTQYGSNSKQLLKEPRTGVFEKILTIA